MRETVGHAGRDKARRPVRVMAVASAGGHWVQLQRMRQAWAGCDTVYVTTDPGYRDAVERDHAERGEAAPRYHSLPDANRWQKLRLLRLLIALLVLILLERPDAVISTGAAPGFFALRIAKALGRRTIWVDSIANAEELSWSGGRIGRHADLWLTQWPHLAGRPDGPGFAGSVI